MLKFEIPILAYLWVLRKVSIKTIKYVTIFAKESKCSVWLEWKPVR